MSSLVLELQQEALNPDVALTDLLRKALVAARKLGIQDFQSWVENELNGYENHELVPDYRKLYGRAEYLNRVRGWEEISFSDNDSEKSWTLLPCPEPISEITVLLDPKSDSPFIVVSYSAEGSKALLKGIGGHTSVRLKIPIFSFARILDTVRTTILNWAMKLEEGQIFGEGMTFTVAEKETAQSPTYNINNFFAPVHSPLIQQQTSESTQVITQVNIDTNAIHEFIEEIRANLHELGLPQEVKDELNAELSTLDAQIGSPKPKASILHESLASVKKILEGASGAIVAQLLMRLGDLT